MMKQEQWREQWDARFRQPEYAYGTQPNVFFAHRLDRLDPGTLLLPAEGEGRNAVYAAQNGWTVAAFDISEQGKNKALALADSKNVRLDYRVGGLDVLDYPEGEFDAIGLVYAHFLPSDRKAYHQRLASLLKPGGVVILEGFAKGNLEYKQRNPGIGGPDNPEALFDVDLIREEFAGLDVVLLEETEAELREGLYHNGVGKVIRFVGQKPL